MLDERGRLLGTRVVRGRRAAGYRELLAWLAIVRRDRPGRRRVDRLLRRRPGALSSSRARRPGARGQPAARAHASASWQERPDRRRDGRPPRARPREPTVDRRSRPTGIVESIRQLRVARDERGEVPHRRDRMQLDEPDPSPRPSELREQLALARRLAGKATLCRRLRPDTDRLHEPVARREARAAQPRPTRSRSSTTRSPSSTDSSQRSSRAAAPRTTSLLGVSTGHAGQLLVTAGQNIERLRNEGAFAALCGASPIPVASGKREPPPPQPRRRPPSQPRAAHDRRLSPALLRPHPRLRPTPHRRRQDQDRDHPLPQALHRPRDLPHPPRRPAAQPPLDTSTSPTVSITCGAGPIGPHDQRPLDIYRNVRGNSTATSLTCRRKPHSYASAPTPHQDRARPPRCPHPAGQRHAPPAPASHRRPARQRTTPLTLELARLQRAGGRRRWQCLTPAAEDGSRAWP